MNDVGQSRLTYALTLHQTMYHTQSNQLGMFSVGAQPLFKSGHANPVYKQSGDKCTECVISRCETRPKLITLTSDVTTKSSSERYRPNGFYTHVADTPPVCSITDRKITGGTQSARHRKFHLHTRSVHNSHLSARAQNGHF